LHQEVLVILMDLDYPLHPWVLGNPVGLEGLAYLFGENHEEIKWVFILK